MFKFLKDKIKKVIEKITKVSEKDVIEEPANEQEIEQARQEEQVQKATELEDTPEAKEYREKKPVVKTPVQKTSPKTPSPKKKISPPTPKKPTPEPVVPEKKRVVVKPEETPEVEERIEEKVVEEVSEVEAAVSEKVVPEKPVEEIKEVERVKEPEAVDAPEKKSFLKKVFGKKEKLTEPIQEEVAPEPVTTESITETPIEEQEVAESVKEIPEPEEPKGLFSKISETFTKKRLTEEKFAELFWDLELSLLENNVAVEVIEKIKADMQTDLTTGKVTRKGIDQLIIDSLRTSIESLFVEPYDLVKKVQQASKRPYIITIIGVNGCGKTTTLAKIANLFQENGFTIVMAASDTFRAAAIDQLKEHANNLGIKLISQGYHADPAAVAFDAIKHAEAQNIDVVLIDTAGRLHSNTNLMAELEKVVRVAKPDLKIFVGESITGNDCVEQAKEFDKAVGINAIILSKADVDEKGGAAISVSYVTGKPILYLGVGQAYGDLRPFDAEKIVKSLGL